MKIDGKTQILGIFGDPVAHSLSPLMQNAALCELAVDAVYVPFHVRPVDLAGAVNALRALRIRGVNVTVPHKEAVLPLLDEVDPAARLIGAVNTIVNRDGRLVGYNTDGLGLLAALRDDLQFGPRGKRVLLLGAGGACRAALAALAGAGAVELRLANRNPARAEALAAGFASHFEGTTFAAFPLDDGAPPVSAVAEVDLIVNTTSVGLKGEELALPWAAIPERARVYDMVYRREGTPLCLRARENGHQAADGLGMLAGQGEAAFRLWTGLEPPFGLMKRRLLAEVSDQ